MCMASQRNAVWNKLWGNIVEKIRSLPCTHAHAYAQISIKRFLKRNLADVEKNQ